VLSLSTRLRRVADLLQNPEQVRVNEQAVMRIGRNIPQALDESDVPSWSEIADALRASLRAEDEFLEVDSSLSADQRRHLRPDR
jgi:hypothetical protein